MFHPFHHMFTTHDLKPTGNELKAITSTPPPDPAEWAFVPENNLLFSDNLEERTSPNEWLSRGAAAMQASLGRI
jgi:putative membrane protein